MPAFTEALGADGALVRVEVGVGRRRRRRLHAAHQPVPPPATLTALIDTGAEVTCIDPQAARPLQLPPARAFTPVNAPAAGGLSFPGSYEVWLTVLHPSGDPA